MTVVVAILTSRSHRFHASDVIQRLIHAIRFGDQIEVARRHSVISRQLVSDRYGRIADGSPRAADSFVCRFLVTLDDVHYSYLIMNSCPQFGHATPP